MSKNRALRLGFLTFTHFICIFLYAEGIRTTYSAATQEEGTFQWKLSWCTHCSHRHFWSAEIRRIPVISSVSKGTNVRLSIPRRGHPLRAKSNAIPPMGCGSVGCNPSLLKLPGSSETRACPIASSWQCRRVHVNMKTDRFLAEFVAVPSKGTRFENGLDRYFASPALLFYKFRKISFFPWYNSRTRRSIIL